MIDLNFQMKTLANIKIGFHFNVIEFPFQIGARKIHTQTNPYCRNYIVKCMHDNYNSGHENNVEPSNGHDKT
jgi:hypothetical protein